MAGVLMTYYVLMIHNPRCMYLCRRSWSHLGVCVRQQLFAHKCCCAKYVLRKNVLRNKTIPQKMFSQMVTETNVFPMCFAHDFQKMFSTGFMFYAAAP